MTKERLDKLMVDAGLCDTRSQAQGLILSGKVRVDGQPVTKAGSQYAAGSIVIELEAPMPYVSRGGFKLEKALQVFPINPAGKICLDIGASSGGFTDCLLQRGAAKVYAIDVGYGQLDWQLRHDTRVVVMEKTNIRTVQPQHLDEPASLAVTDVSFISLKKVLPGVPALMNDTGDRDIIALLKPQFEYRDYGTDKSFKGVVRGEEQHRLILTGVLTDLSDLLPDWQVAGLDFSPITGPKGNIEYLLHLKPGSNTPGLALAPTIDEAIKKSYDFHTGIGN